MKCPFHSARSDGICFALEASRAIGSDGRGQPITQLLIYFEFCRVCVASDLLRDHVDVAIACCCFVLGSKKAEHEDKV